MSETPTDGGFDPIDFLTDAVAIPSHEDVAGMRSSLVGALEDASVDVTVDAAGNTLARRGSPAAGSGPHLVLNTHIDTVPPHVPFERDGDVVRGRGACDAKGPLAALLAGFLGATVRRGRLTLAVTPDEETLSTGAAALVGANGNGGGDENGNGGGDDGRGGSGDGNGNEGDPATLDGDLYIVGEPTGLDVCPSARGRFEATVELFGTAGHAAEAASGANAVAALEPALAAVRTFDDGREPHPQLGGPSLTPTVVSGGGAANQVPESCRLTVDRRSVPPETAAEFRDGLAAAVGEAVPAGIRAEVAMADRPTPFLGPFATDRDHELVRTLATAAGEAGATAAAGTGGSVRPFTAATEAAYFAPAPTVVFGPGDLKDAEGAVAHARREYVRVPEVRAAGRAVERAATELLG